MHFWKSWRNHFEQFIIQTDLGGDFNKRHYVRVKCYPVPSVVKGDIKKITRGDKVKYIRMILGAPYCCFQTSFVLF